MWDVYDSYTAQLWRLHVSVVCECKAENDVYEKHAVPYGNCADAWDS